MQRRGNVEDLVSAGGVVYRKFNDHLEIVLCGLRSSSLWALPKGTPEEGESLEQTALREVREETGLDVDIQASLGTIEYWFSGGQNGTRYHKTVHFYLMVPTGGDFSRHDPEFDEVRWYPEHTVLNTMTYRDEINLVEKAIGIARAGTG